VPGKEIVFHFVLVLANPEYLCGGNCGLRRFFIPATNCLVPGKRKERTFVHGKCFTILSG